MWNKRFLKNVLKLLTPKSYNQIQEIKKSVVNHKGIYLMDTEILKMAIDNLHNQEVKKC